APDSEEGYWLTHDVGVWISSPEFAFDDVRPVPLALFQTDCKYHAAAVNGLTKQGTSYQLLACSNTASAQRAIVKAGLAIGAMGKLSVTPDLKILEDMPPLPSVDIVLILASKPHPVLD
ncbi:LysR family transcriptional regulator, partial [Vibrio sp. 10N.222.49.E5]